MADEDPPWRLKVPLSDLRHGAKALELQADAPTRGRIARALDLVALESLTAAVRVAPWLDGVEVSGRWAAAIVQTCGVSLEPFGSELAGTFEVRAAPSASAVSAAALDEPVEVDPDAEDPPDPLEGDAVDVGAYVVEHLALEIDPFPRRPGAAFEPPPAEAPPSPFAVLARLKRDSDSGPR